jgi:microcompartment protein CcmL/EutN
MAKKDLPIFDIEMCEDGCGLDYISLVKSPAIEIMALAFDKDVEKINFSFNKFSQIVAGPAMVPDKLIYRNDPDMGEFYVRFTKEVIAKLAEKFNKTAKEIKINMDHKTEVPSAFVLGNWIIEDSEKDKANYKYGFKDLPVGTWFVEVKIDDSKVFEDEVIDNLKNGFSVEGLFDLSYASFNKVETFETYNDYPEVVKNNAQRALDWVEENGWGDCGTDVGKARANQLAKGENISRETIARMSAFARHLQYNDLELGDGCGKLMILAWGGKEGIEWAQRKLEEIDEEFVIVPNPNEDEDTFIERCMSIETKSFEQEQAYAICKNKYDNKFKKEEKMENKLKFAAHKLEDGTTIYASDLAVGAEVYTIDENLDKVPVFDGTHKLTDGKTISTVDGKITEVKDAMEMAVETEEEVEAAVEEVVEVPEVVEDEVDVMTAITPKLDELWMAIAELTSKVEGMSLPEKKEEFKTDKPTFHETFSNVLSNLKKLNK